MMGVGDVIITPVTYCWVVLPFLLVDIHTWVQLREGEGVMLRDAGRACWKGPCVAGLTGALRALGKEEHQWVPQTAAPSLQ